MTSGAGRQLMDGKKVTTLRAIDDEAYRCLRSGEVDKYLAMVASRESVDLSSADLRGADLRRIDPAKVILRGAYLRDADLRGLDLRALDLEGCSIFHAKVSGVYFPLNLSSEEIRLSLDHGTRLRCKSGA